MTVEKEVKVIISAVDQYSDGMSGFTKLGIAVVASVEAMAAAMVAASIKAAEFAVALGDRIWTSATDFHDAMYNVEAVAQSFGTTGQQIGEILDELTMKFPLTGAQAGASMQLIAQLGYGTEQQLRAMSDAANTLQIATGADLQTGIMGTLAILNSFNMDASEATRVINLLAAASFSSAANIEDLGISLRYAGPIAAIMGLSIEETVAALASLRDRGLEASQAGTTLRMALVQLGKETKAKTEVLRKYGLTYEDVNPQVVGLTGVVKAFNGQVIDGADAATLFGVRSVAMAHIINMGAEAFDGYTKSITGTTAAQDAFLKKMETWTVVQKQVAGDMDRLRNAIGGDLVISILHLIGTNEKEGLRGIINYIIEVEKATGKLADQFAGPIKIVVDAVKALFQQEYNNSYVELYNQIQLIALALGENIHVLTIWGTQFFTWAHSMIDDTQDIKNALTLLNEAFLVLSLPIVLIHDAWALFVNTITGTAMIIEQDMYRLGIAFQQLKIWLAEVIGMIPFFGDSMKKVIDESKAKIEEYGNKIVSVQKEWENTDYMNFWLDDLEDTVGKAQNAIDSIQPPKELTLFDAQEIQNKAAIKALQEFDAEWERIAEAAWKRQQEADTKGLEAIKSYEKTFDEVAKTTEDGIIKIASIQAPGDLVFDNLTGKAHYFKGEIIESTEAVESLDKAIDDMSDREFSLYTKEFEAQLAEVAAQAERTHKEVMARIEWKAKLDIEEVKANAEILKAAFESVGQSVESTAKAASSMFSDLADLLSGDKWLSSTTENWLKKQVETQLQLQADALQIQKDLTAAEIRNLDAKTEKIRDMNKEAMITVDGDGLKPHLEAMMWEVFEAVQIRATEEGLDKLLLGGALTSE